MVLRLRRNDAAPCGSGSATLVCLELSIVISVSQPHPFEAAPAPGGEMMQHVLVGDKFRVLLDSTFTKNFIHNKLLISCQT
jgi:hypothetical protein